MGGERGNGEGKRWCDQVFLQMITTTALCGTHRWGPGVGGRPSRGTAVVQARDNTAGGDNSSKDGERYTILEGTESTIGGYGEGLVMGSERV